VKRSERRSFSRVRPSTRWPGWIRFGSNTTRRPGDAPHLAQRRPGRRGGGELPAAHDVEGVGGEREGVGAAARARERIAAEHAAGVVAGDHADLFRIVDAGEAAPAPTSRRRPRRRGPRSARCRTRWRAKSSTTG
jgi:hypothetical protein